MTHHTKGNRPCCRPDIDETRDHILAAGRELLLAAQGALHFCKDYVESQVPEANRPALLGFFKKAIAVSDELANSICGVSAIKRTAENIAKPFFTAIEREMRSQDACCSRKHSRPRRAAKRPLKKRR